jgi:hypothetical protein
LFQRGHQESGQGEVTEDIRAELEFETVRGLETPGGRHDAGVVDEDVEWAMTGEFFFCELADGTEGGEIQNGELGVGSWGVGMQAGESLFTTLPVSTGEYDLGPFTRQLQCGVVADAAVRAGDDDSFTG